MSKIGFLERALWVWVIMSAFVSTIVLALGIIKARTESKSDEALATLHRDLDGFTTKEES